jgi:hypothetical protein
MPREYLRRESDYCSNCGLKNVLAKERCSACYKWWKYQGVERPRRLWDPNALCENRNCRRPLEKVVRRYKSLCPECSLYWSLTGEYRPRKYCNRRWCDCGQVAAREVELKVGWQTKTGKVGIRKEKYWLCQDCLDEEFGNE